MYIYTNRDRYSLICLSCGRISNRDSTLPDWSELRTVARKDMLYGYCEDCTTRQVADAGWPPLYRHAVKSWCRREEGVREHETAYS